MNKLSKHGPDKNQDFSDTIEDGDCPHCNGEGTLIYGIKSVYIDDDGLETTPVEGLVCKECKEIFMSLDESARLLNLKAKFDGVDIYYGVHDGDITEGRLQ